MPSPRAALARLVLLSVLGLAAGQMPKLPWSSTSPPPPGSDTRRQAAADLLSEALADNTVVIFSRMACGASKKIKEYFEDAGIPYYALEIDARADGDALKGALHERTGSDKTPAVYIRGQLVGGYDIGKAHKTGELIHWTNT